jgi:hypothetical protein
VRLELTPAPDDSPSAIVAQSFDETGWRTEILPGSTRRLTVPRTPRGKVPAEIRITLVGRTGLEGTPAIWMPTN